MEYTDEELMEIAEILAKRLLRNREREERINEYLKKKKV